MGVDPSNKSSGTGSSRVPPTESRFRESLLYPLWGERGSRCRSSYRQFLARVDPMRSDLPDLGREALLESAQDRADLLPSGSWSCVKNFTLFLGR